MDPPELVEGDALFSLALQVHHLPAREADGPHRFAQAPKHLHYALRRHVLKPTSSTSSISKQGGKGIVKKSMTAPFSHQR